jgi:2-deoxy-D-gluconate 3-dehydrogenase
MTALFDLSGKAAVVTGACTGLGAGMAAGLAEAGADILLVDRNPSGETASAVRAAGGRAEEMKLDLTEEGAPAAVIGAAVRAFGKVDILINSAGIIRRAPAIDYGEQDWDEVMAVNSRAVFFLCQAAARNMIPRGKGKIVNIASLLSFQGGVIVPAYSASKGAVAQMTKALANEWAPFGINVNAIAPGYMATNNTKALRDDPARSKAILDRIPAGRWGTPGDVAGTAVFLASAASDYVNGHVLAVDGGWLAR